MKATRQITLGRVVLGAIVLFLTAVSVNGCQSAEENSSTADQTLVATPKEDTARISAPAVPATTASDPAPAPVTASSAKPATSTAKEPSANPAIVPTTAAEPAAKPAAPAQTISEGVVVAAKAAFEKNKCGTCHFVGAFPATKPSTAKHDLGSAGIVHSSDWISGYLQKKEKLNDKFHIKTFAGTDAERSALSQWLAAQKAEPQPTK